MLKRIVSIGVILVGSTVAWMILAASIASRSFHSTEKLRPDLESTWGAEEEQPQPLVVLQKPPALLGPATETGPVLAEAERSRIRAELNLEYRQKGLLWYSTYVVHFSGVYTFRNAADGARRMRFDLPLPAKRAIYDGMSVSANGHTLPWTVDTEGALASVDAQPGELVEFRVEYRSRGLDSWRYSFGKDVKQMRDFELTLATNFRDIDFPASTLSPVSKRRTKDGWELAWRYRSLISGYEIGIAMPQRLQPGPLAGEICTFAPVSLLLFFCLLFIVAIRRQIELHPMNYLFLAAAFFSFHLLMAYSVDHISIQWAFALSSLVSIGLVVSYLRLVVGERFAIKEAGLAQFVYLILFSFSFFLKGFTGLAVTLGCIVTLFVAMQVTARVPWRELFAVPGERR